MNGAVIYGGIRSPFGRYGGSLSAKRPDNLATSVIMALLDRSGIESSLVENVIFGNTNKACEACRNVARNAVLLAGMHTSVGGVTVNRLCGSGAAATLGASSAQLILTALRQLENIQSRYALITMCIGIGQGIAVVIERVQSQNREPS